MPPASSPWYHVEDEATIATPALLLYRDASSATSG